MIFKPCVRLCIQNNGVVSNFYIFAYFPCAENFTSIMLLNRFLLQKNTFHFVGHTKNKIMWLISESLKGPGMFNSWISEILCIFAIFGGKMFVKSSTYINVMIFIGLHAVVLGYEKTQSIKTTCKLYCLQCYST